MDKKFQYIEIIRMEGNKVVKRMDVTGKSQSSIDRVERGVGINLNHKEYYTSQKDSDVELPTDDKEVEKEKNEKK